MAGARGGGPADLRVEGPEARGVTDADIRRLFPGRSAGDRLNRLRNWPRIVVRIDDVPVGVATFTQTPIEMQIPDFAVDIPPVLDLDHGNVRPQIISALLEAIEIAALAAGCRRIVIIQVGRCRLHPSRLSVGQRRVRRFVDGKVPPVKARISRGVPEIRRRLFSIGHSFHSHMLATGTSLAVIGVAPRERVEAIGQPALGSVPKT